MDSNHLDDLDKLLIEADLPVCLINSETGDFVFSNRALQFSNVFPNLKAAFLEMLEDKNTVAVKKISKEEFIILYIGRYVGTALFLFLKTADIEKNLSKMDIVKAAKEEVDTILNNLHDDVLISDGNGIVIKADPSFEKLYNVMKENIEGRSVYELEKEGVLCPSITARVLTEKQQITSIQENKQGRRIVTAIPIKNQDGNIEKVISFSRDLTDFFKLKKEYEMLEEAVKKYTAEIEELREKQLAMPGIVINSKVMKDIMETIDRVSVYDANIVLEGESGVGKTLFAKLIHSKSSRSKGPFIEINCGSIPENLLESELFGYEKGAFTGANQNGKIGLIQLADKGTLFLDEIGELPLNLQTKLLKVIQDKKILKIGGTQVIDVDFRLIAATNKNLKKLIFENKFREDLYYRLNVIYIELPPLRRRRDDILNIAIYYLDKFNKKYNQNKVLSSKAIERLMSYEWPGNIRELENLVERIVLTVNNSRSIIDVEDLPYNIKSKYSAKYEAQPLNEAVEQFEKHLVLSAYRKHRTTIGVARELGISQPTAARKIKKYVGRTKRE